MLRNIYNDKQSSFIKLQEKSNSVSFLEQNLQILAIEIYKVRNELSSSLMRNILKLSIKICIYIKQSFQFLHQEWVLCICVLCV